MTNESYLTASQSARFWSTSIQKAGIVSGLGVGDYRWNK